MKNSILTSFFLLVFLILNACKRDDPDKPIEEPLNSIPDIDVQWISRTPKIPFIENSQNATVDGWPEVNDEIHWNARVRTLGDIEFNNVTFEWLINGTVIASGMVDLEANDVQYFHLPWRWTFDRNKIEFRIVDFESEKEELTTGNNSLAIYSDALAVGFAVTDEMRDYFSKTQNGFNESSNSFEDWAQFQLSQWNKILATPSLPENPNGIQDRVRLDTIWEMTTDRLFSIHFDGVTGSTTIETEYDLRSVDLYWGFHEDNGMFNLNFFRNSQISRQSILNPNKYNGTLFHEIGHVRGLIDVYAFDLFHEPERGDTINIIEKGVPLPELMRNWFPRYSYFTGLMGYNYLFMDRFSAVVLNQIARQRKRSLILDESRLYTQVPNENVFIFKDRKGDLVKNANVKFFYDYSKEYYLSSFSNEYVFETHTNDKGEAQMPDELKDYLQENPFFPYSTNQRARYKPNTLIIRVEDQTKTGYGFYESYWFPIKYWENPDKAIHEIKIQLLEQ